MAMVWVQRESSQGAGLLFPLHNDRLLVTSIAAHWHLDPSTLQVGDLALSCDANGNSIFSLEEIRAYSSAAGLGDGLTKQSAFTIKGERKAEEVKRNVPPPKPLVEQVAAAAVPEECFKKLSFKERQQLYPLRDRLKQEQRNAMRQQMFKNEDGIHHYISRIKSESLEKVVAPFVGAVFVVPRNKAVEEIARSDAAGMATLVRPEGLFFTASDCLPEPFDEQRLKIVVELPGDAFYECRILESDTLSLVVHLETLEKQSFSSCPVIRDSSAGFFMFDRLSKSMKLVHCFEVETWGMEMMILPSSKVDPRSILGGPVFNHAGEIRGIVVDASNFLLPDNSTSKKQCYTRLGRKLGTQKVSMLEPYKKEAEVWAGIHSSLGYTQTLTAKEAEYWRDALYHRRLVECWRVSVRACTEDWMVQNPLTKFMDKVVARPNKPSLRCVKVPVRQVTEQLVREVDEQQEALSKVSHLLRELRKAK